MMYAELMGNHKKLRIKSHSGNKIDIEFGHKQKKGRFVPAIGKRLVAEEVPAKPFLRPAIENYINEYKQIIENVLRQLNGN